MTTIPPDIEAIIHRVDQQGDESLLPRTDAPIDKYDVLLEETFPDWQLVNVTDFEYGRSYYYNLVLSMDRDAAALAEEVLIKAVRRAGSVEQINIAISTLAPYADIQFIRYSLDDRELVEEQATEPLSETQLEALGSLLTVLEKQGIRRISPEIAALDLPEIQTELSDDNATVADCLFYG